MELKIQEEKLKKYLKGSVLKSNTTLVATTQYAKTLSFEVSTYDETLVYKLKIGKLFKDMQINEEAARELDPTARETLRLTTQKNAVKVFKSAIDALSFYFADASKELFGQCKLQANTNVSLLGQPNCEYQEIKAKTQTEFAVLATRALSTMLATSKSWWVADSRAVYGTEKDDCIIEMKPLSQKEAQLYRSFSDEGFKISFTNEKVEDPSIDFSKM